MKFGEGEEPEVIDPYEEEEKNNPVIVAMLENMPAQEIKKILDEIDNLQEPEEILVESLEQVKSNTHTPEQTLENKDTLGKILEHLSIQQRNVWIEYMLGKSFQEIATRLDLSLKEVESIYSEGNLKIQKLIDFKTMQYDNINSLH